MSRLKDFKLPDLGEGLTEGEILQWLVAEGDTITLNQPIVEVETAKAAVEVPSPYAGVVVTLHHPAGSTVDVGSPIITVDTEPGAGPLPTAPEAAAPAAAPAAPAAAPVTSRPASPEDLVPAAPKEQRQAVLVGYGPRSGAVTRRPRKDAAPAPAAAAAPSPVATPVDAAAARFTAASVSRLAARSAGSVAVLAKPPVRKLAKDLGVDLAQMVGTGAGGTITRADVEGAARPGLPALQSDGTGRLVDGPPFKDHLQPSYDPATRERRIPIKGVRKHTAAAMVGSAFTAPHVTEFITFDMTPTMELVTRLRALPEFADVKVTPLLLVAKALLMAVRRNPEINATWDEAAQEIVVKSYVNLGIAAATPRGLLVPNIKDADRLDLVGLGQALQSLVATARDGRTAPTDMQHGTITITNVGTFGVDTGTPIINPGESAILCFGAVRPTPWVVDGQVVPRMVTQLSLSFDHRNVDGALGSQFLADVARVLGDPTTALAWS